MAIGLATAGARLTAALFNSVAPLAVIKPSDQSVTSSTTLVNDSALFLPVVANATYLFEAYLIYTAASGGDLKFQWAVPAAATLNFNALHNEGGGTGLSNSVLNTAAATIVFCAGSGATVVVAALAGSLSVAATAGNLTLQWAQNTSNATATVMKAGSHVALWRVT